MIIFEVKIINDLGNTYFNSMMPCAFYQMHDIRLRLHPYGCYVCLSECVCEGGEINMRTRGKFVCI